MTQSFDYEHYIRLDGDSFIIYGFSTAFEQPEPDDICINEAGGYQFRLFPGGQENPLLYSDLGYPLYKWNGIEVVPA